MACTGQAGAGKTVMSAIVIEDLKASFPSSVVSILFNEATSSTSLTPDNFRVTFKPGRSTIKVRAAVIIQRVGGAGESHPQAGGSSRRPRSQIRRDHGQHRVFVQRSRRFGGGSEDLEADGIFLKAKPLLDTISRCQNLASVHTTLAASSGSIQPRHSISHPFLANPARLPMGTPPIPFPGLR